MLRSVLVVAVLGAPATGKAQPAPGDLFTQLEQGLLGATRVEITCVVASTGAVTSSLEGSLVIERDGAIVLGFSGTLPTWRSISGWSRTANG